MEHYTVQWYPGHMAKTKKEIEKNLKLVDLVVEIVDARIPRSSRNPDLGRMTQGKPRIVLMNKSDMADPVETAKWLVYFREEGFGAVSAECKTGKGLNAIFPLTERLLKDRIAFWKSKGLVGRKIRIMAVGIPNVGKSSLINRLAGKGRAEVANKPGVTRSSQWFSIGSKFELLDTPGVLWPKFEDPVVGEHLAFTGAVREDILDSEQLACRLLAILSEEFRQPLSQRYHLSEEDFLEIEGRSLLERIAKKRGMMQGGGEPDTERAARTVLEEFRNAKIGRITLERTGESK